MRATTVVREKARRKRCRQEEKSVNGRKQKSSSGSDKVVNRVVQLGFELTERVSWGKYQPYSDAPLQFVCEGVSPAFAKDSPALCFHVNALSNRARACSIHLQPQPGQHNQSTAIPTPMFMPVGTKGCMKALSFEELTSDPALACPIILANTYHLAIQPGTDLVRDMNGLHAFQGGCVCTWKQDSQIRRVRYNLLTDSGGFQMVSLAKFSLVSEEGVQFENPFRKHKDQDPTEKDLLLLTPEDSIRHQNNIGANIIMALDDVVSAVVDDDDRFEMATHRTLRWYDRCYDAHAKKETQNLFPIVQGGLDTELGGLREICLAGFRHRQVNLGYQIPGYAIGGLAGGESKEQFWKVVDQCCRALPDDKPRYLMGVGYPLDLVVCTALGVDLYDCVYPTRTARFGVCLVPGQAPGTLRLKSHDCSSDNRVIDDTCQCQSCRYGVSRARLHLLLKAGNPIAVELISQHNIAHMMRLVRSMREEILQGTFSTFVSKYINDLYPGKDEDGEAPPIWVIEALESAGIQVTLTV